MARWARRRKKKPRKNETPEYWKLFTKKRMSTMAMAKKAPKKRALSLFIGSG